MYHAFRENPVPVCVLGELNVYLPDRAQAFEDGQRLAGQQDAARQLFATLLAARLYVLARRYPDEGAMLAAIIVAPMAPLSPAKFVPLHLE